MLKSTPKFKSKFENLVWNTLLNKNVSVEYEPDKIKYIIPASEHTYCPDFKLRDKVYIEAKGLFDYDSRQKMLLVKETYPDYTFYLAFQNANTPIRKGSKTTYADWCVKHGFEYCHMPAGIPQHWLFPNKKRKRKK